MAEIFLGRSTPTPRRRAAESIARSRTRAQAGGMRLDQWLWAVRLYKTRTLATDAIRAGHVKIDGETVKPAREARPGDVVVALANQLTRTVRVLGAPPSRVAAKLVGQFAEDLTPPEEYERRREASLGAAGVRPPGAGRPTKLDRRALDKAARRREAEADERW